MPSTKEFLNFILEQLNELPEITYRPMMGEFLVYYQGRLAGGIYDDRLLIKNVPSARNFMPDAELVSPYDGAKQMLLVDNVDDKEFLSGLFNAIYDELPVPKTKKK
ncbi:MAG: competence protein TfoX [Clostridiales bacterium]|nr:competence protein TfoX [Clostridiales bacterium]